jgi:glutaredoxin
MKTHGLAMFPFARLSKLWTWLGLNAPGGLEHWRVILYTRRGCHLCASSADRLGNAQRRFRFALEMVDVDADQDLTARYGEQVPVVTINGKVRFRGCVNPVLFNRLLLAETRRRRTPRSPTPGVSP